MTQIEKINQEINVELSNEATVRALLATTFKGLDAQTMKRALIEGMIRGWKFEDFLKRRVYAIPFKNWKTQEIGYTLLGSIDHFRSIAMKSGVVGKDAPMFEEADGKLVSCSVTVKRKFDEYIGDFTATVYFDEYNKPGKEGKPSNWDNMPRTMLAKVAEMHALRMACPDELDKAYIEDEVSQDNDNVIDGIDSDLQAKIDACQTVEEVNAVYKENKGRGKAFDKAIIAKKQELEAKPEEQINYPKPTGTDGEQPPF